MWSVALCGNEVADQILRSKFQQYAPSGDWNLVSRFVPQELPGEPEIFAEAMHQRAHERARQVLSEMPDAAIGIAFEYSTIRTAPVVNLIDLDLLSTPEELTSPKTRRTIQERQKEAERTQPNTATVSVVVVVSRDETLFSSMTSTGVWENGKRFLSFSYWRTNCGDHPELVDLRGKVVNQTAFVRAVRDALVDYDTFLSQTPGIKN